VCTREGNALELRLAAFGGVNREHECRAPTTINGWMSVRTVAQCDPVRSRPMDVCVPDNRSYNSSYDKSAATGDYGLKTERSRLDAGFNVVSQSE